VATGGIAGNWLWWNFVASGMLTVFFYARLWRRSGVMTDIEFTEFRCSALRGFRADIRQCGRLTSSNPIRPKVIK